MTTVCLVGDGEVNLQYELLSRETARDALVAYDLRQPFHNSIAVQTVSLGAAVSLLNDLDWYLVRFVEQGLVFDPSVSESEWLSRSLAEAIRDETLDPADSGRYLKVYGLDVPDDSTGAEGETADASGGGELARERVPPGSERANEVEEPAEEGSDAEERDEEPTAPIPGVAERGREGTDADAPLPRLVEPMFVTRTGESIPEYDLRPVADTLVVRVTESEFGA